MILLSPIKITNICNLDVLDSKALEALTQKADKFLITHDHETLKTFLKLISDTEYSFERLIDEAHFYYMLGNCSQELFDNCQLDWFSDELSKAVICFRKALYIFKKIESPTEEEQFLQSCIETNLGNNLSHQGRAFCCIPLWDTAYKHNKNPVAIISKAKHAFFLAESVYDPNHIHYHYFIA
jgi:hypothetical protein